jgi:hypothetical protein
MHALFEPRLVNDVFGTQVCMWTFATNAALF